MLLAFLRWLGKNLGTLLLSFILAMAVWVSAVVTADPNEKRAYSRPIPLEQIGKDSNLFLSGDVPTTVRVTLDAPQSIWTQLNNNPNLIKAWIDLSGLGPGDHTVPVKVQVDASPVRWQVEPQSISVTLEPLDTVKMPVQLNVNGEPPLGYKRGVPELSPAEVTVSGPASLVKKVALLRATLDISGARDTKKVTIPVEAFDENGEILSGLTITPKVITVTQPISLEASYKNVVVKVVTKGQIANGYRLTNISVTPPNVTVFSANPALINGLPGYVETQPVDLSGLSDDTEVRIGLNLPPEISLVGVQSVLVQVSVAAIEDSLTVSVPVEQLGLPPDLEAHISPASVDVIISGPLPVLDTLTSASFRAVVDLTGLEPGTYQISPEVDLVPEQVQVQSILPETVEVNITEAATPTPPSLALPGSISPTSTPTPTPTRTPTPTPTRTPTLAPTATTTKKP